MCKPVELSPDGGGNLTFQVVHVFHEENLYQLYQIQIFLDTILDSLIQNTVDN